MPEMKGRSITCQQMHDALVASIEKRWIPLSNGASLEDEDVENCHLCLITDDAGDCHACPLYLTGNGCTRAGRSPWEGKSPWEEFIGSKTPLRRKQAAQRMLDVLRMCKDKFFPEGWDK